MDVKPPGQRGPGAAPSLPHVRGCLGVSSASRRPPWWFPGRGDTAGLLPGRQESDHRAHRATGITGDQTIPSRHWTARKPRPRTPRTGANTLHQPLRAAPGPPWGLGNSAPKHPGCTGNSRPGRPGIKTLFLPRITVRRRIYACEITRNFKDIGS